jgi:hypothetical protein
MMSPNSLANAAKEAMLAANRLAPSTPSTNICRCGRT